MAGIYIHIPFCKQACSYCDFHFSTKLERRSEMVEGIVKELELRQDYLQEQEIESIYFGGGTPSLLNEAELELIFNQIQKKYRLSDDLEICLEANPDDLNKSKLKELSSSPINRLSIGIQSFFDADLQFMNRAHNAKEAIDSIKFSQDAGFSNLSIDLIFGSPSTTDSMWKENLAQFFALDIPHLSAYSLTIEDKTALKRQIDAGKIKKPKDEQAFRQYSILQQEIDLHQFEQYELSNYCRGNKFSRHNSSYWKQKPYLGVGPSAHSYDNKSRQWNLSNNALYLKKINQNEAYFEREILSEKDKYHEYLITSMRSKWGISRSYLKENFSASINAHFEKQVKRIKANLLYLNQDQISVVRQHWFQSDFLIRDLWMD